MLKKLWHDPVWSTVIAGVILLVVGALATYFDWWPTILRSSTTAYHFLGQHTPVANWLLGLLILLAVAFVAVVAVIIISITRQPQPPVWHSYTQDTFDGLVWRWRYAGNDIDSLAAYCPHCDLALVTQPGPYRAALTILYYCERCRDVMFAGEGESAADVHDRIKRFIALEIRKRWGRN